MVSGAAQQELEELEERVELRERELQEAKERVSEGVGGDKEWVLYCCHSNI